MEFSHKRRGPSGIFEFEPVAFETSGVWGPMTSKFLATMKRKLFDITNDHKDNKELCQQMTLCKNRGNNFVLHSAIAKIN